MLTSTKTPLNKIPKWAQAYISEDGFQHVEHAIVDAEKKTSGELRTVLVRSSSTLDHLLPMTTYLLWVILLLLEAPLHLEVWFSQHLTSGSYTLSLLFCFGAGYGLVYLALKTSLVQRGLARWGVSAKDQHSQVLMRAQNEFYHLEMQNTQGATGILLFISLLEKRAVVLADKSISQHHPPETWQEVIDSMISGIKKQNIAEGFSLGVELCGNILAQHFPIQDDDINELENHLVIKE